MRADIVGPPEPEAPYPVVCDTVVVAGYGRGSSELGIPTANIPQEQFDQLSIGQETGVYFGWSLVLPDPHMKAPKGLEGARQVEFNYGTKLTETDQQVYPMVMSVGWNPFYNNEKKSAEIHIMHEFSDSFYGARIKFMVVGYIRPELNYTTKEALIEDIKTDIKVTRTSLERPGYEKYKSNEFFKR